MNLMTRAEREAAAVTQALATADLGNREHFYAIVRLMVGGSPLSIGEGRTVFDGFASDRSAQEVSEQIRQQRIRRAAADAAASMGGDIEHDYETCTDRRCTWYECEQRRKRAWGRSVLS